MSAAADVIAEWRDELSATTRSALDRLDRMHAAGRLSGEAHASITESLRPMALMGGPSRRPILRAVKGEDQ